jgi:menaquinone-dependent protoporphyrinogen IX oxidase
MGQWTKEVTKFVKKNVLLLRSLSIPIGFFVSSGIASHPETYEEAKKSYILDKITNLNLNVSLYDAFGGKLDLTQNSKLSWLDKKIVKAMSKEDSRIQIDKTNDFRNWSKITMFTKNFLKIVS